MARSQNPMILLPCSRKPGSTLPTAAPARSTEGPGHTVQSSQRLRRRISQGNSSGIGDYFFQPCAGLLLFLPLLSSPRGQQASSSGAETLGLSRNSSEWSPGCRKEAGQGVCGGGDAGSVSPPVSREQKSTSCSRSETGFKQQLSLLHKLQS